VQYKPLRDEQGRVVRWYATGTDIDERKRAEERTQNENLALREEVNRASMFEEIVGSSPAIQAMRVEMIQVDPTDSTVLITSEIGELPEDTQLALLRVLQEREFERVGGNRPIRVDVRVVAATNRELRAAVAAKSFRADLFYRLNVFPIEVPALRNRAADIPLL